MLLAGVRNVLSGQRAGAAPAALALARADLLPSAPVASDTGRDLICILHTLIKIVTSI